MRIVSPHKLSERTGLFLLSAALMLGASNAGWAANSIGASFIGRGADPADILNPTNSAGVVPQTHWNNVDSGTTFKGTTLSLIDSADTFTGVKIIYDCSDSWNSSGGTVTPNEKLMKGIIKANPEPDTAPANNSERMLFVGTNVPAGTYNVIVYLMENDIDCAQIAGGNPAGTNCAEVDVTVGATTYYVEQQGVFGGTFTAATSTTPG